MQQAAKNDDALDTPEDTSQTTGSKPSPRVMGAGLVLALILIAFLFLRGGSDNEATDAPELTPEVAATATPVITPTPTPLALEAQDNIIEDSDDERAIAYPVSLQVTLADSSPPRVWVVLSRPSFMCQSE